MSILTPGYASPNYGIGMIMAGVKIKFGETAPPMPPVALASTVRRLPAMQPARSYLVFFDWDKATLTDRARQIIKEAADNSTHVQYTRIEVNGYTDTSGTPQYNQGLSIRRAEAVKAELIKDGVPAARDHAPKASARRICWCPPAPACASRRTAASRSSSSDGWADHLMRTGRRKAPLFVWQTGTPANHQQT